MNGLDVIIEDDRWEDLQALASIAVPATLQHQGCDPKAHEVVILGCNDSRIADLNQDFRDKAKPTNVLSWPSFDLAAEDDGGTPDTPDEDLGNVAISFETCAREAIDQNKPFKDHVTHLIVHGVLHLLGYDHIRDRDAALMENIERQILGKLGIADPY